MDLFAGIKGLFDKGGFTMVLLALCSIIAVAIVIERLIYFAQQSGNPKALLAQIKTRIEANDLPGAIALCSQNPKAILQNTLRFGLVRGSKSRTDITDALSIALMENLSKLEQNLSVIGTIAVIAPFVGLFGTVLGIIHAFEEIALKGNSSPAVVAQGVGEALVTTAGGLIVAVISVVFFNYFKARIKSYNREMIASANYLAEMLHFHNVGEAIPADFAQTSIARVPTR